MFKLLPKETTIRHFTLLITYLKETAAGVTKEYTYLGGDAFSTKQKA